MYKDDSNAEAIIQGIEMKVTKKDWIIYIILWIVVITSITVGLILCSKQPTVSAVSNESVTVDNKVENITFCDDEKINTLLQKALTGIDTYNYSVYYEIKAKWNQEIDQKDLEQLYKLGGNESSFEGMCALAVATTVTKNKELMSVMSQQNLPFRLDAKSIKTLFDFDTHKSYSQTVSVIDTEATDWVESDFEEPLLKYIDFVHACEFKNLTEDDEHYYINAIYDYAKDKKDHETDNNFQMIMDYAESVYGLEFAKQIPFVMTISKTNGMLIKLEYDFNDFNGRTMLHTYTIKEIDATINTADWNKAELQIPLDLQDKVKE